MRLSRPYSYGSAARAWLRSWRRPGQFTLSRRARNRAVICSQLFHEAYWKQPTELWSDVPTLRFFLPS